MLDPHALTIGYALFGPAGVLLPEDDHDSDVRAVAAKPGAACHAELVFRVGKQEFRYDASTDQYICPQGAVLRRVSPLHEQRYSLYQAEVGHCGYGATSRPGTTSRPMRSASSGSSLCLARRRRGTA